ncbi:unnamed protein product [Schistosoma curassoni]|uniref:Transmembrane protein n=1 Tax=Schistosoma curassoni TaxID=6186 RepID=A0A183JWM0_9TREM|nr:unnamed protein product [Schistosoma curassoni]
MGINTLYDNSMNDNVRITTISSLKPEQLKIVNINEKDAISRLYVMPVIPHRGALTTHQHSTPNHVLECWVVVGVVVGVVVVGGGGVSFVFDFFSMECLFFIDFVSFSSIKEG